MATTTLRARIPTHDTGELLSPPDTTRALRLALGVVLVAGLLAAATAFLGVAQDQGSGDDVAQVGD